MAVQVAKKLNGFVGPFFHPMVIMVSSQTWWCLIGLATVVTTQTDSLGKVYNNGVPMNHIIKPYKVIKPYIIIYSIWFQWFMWSYLIRLLASFRIPCGHGSSFFVFPHGAPSCERNFREPLVYGCFMVDSR